MLLLLFDIQRVCCICQYICFSCTGMEGWVGDALPGVFGVGEGVPPSAPLSISAENVTTEQEPASKQADATIQYTVNGKRK